jgi:hypothetical protein
MKSLDSLGIGFHVLGANKTQILKPDTRHPVKTRLKRSGSGEHCVSCGKSPALD